MADAQMILSDFSDDLALRPPMWDCMKTCAHMGEEVSRFPGTNTPRCDYGYNRDHLHGGMVEKLINNRCFFWCKYYEEARQ